MKERIDQFLQRNFRFRGKAISLDRLTWWFVIALTRIFGREVELYKGSRQNLRIFPVIWNGKIHLLGAEHETLRVTFTSQYTLRLEPCPDLTETPATTIPWTSSTPSVAHVVLGHLAPEPMDAVLNYIRTLSRDYQLVLTYGGRKENFDRISYGSKVFIDDASLRGPSYRMSYFGLMTGVRDLFAQMNIDPEWIFLGDYDLLPFKNDYLAPLIELMKLHKAGFGGKVFHDVSNSNRLFLTQAVQSSLFESRTDLNGPGKKLIYACLGCGYLLHRDCFRAIIQERADLESLYFELALPTAAALHGYRLLSFDQVSDYFRNVVYRPVLSCPDALHLAEAGADFLHPVKDTADFVREWSTRRKASKTLS